MLRPKKAIPKLTVAALALTGCANDEPPLCGVNEAKLTSGDVPPIVDTFCMDVVVECYAEQYPDYTVDDCIFNASCFFGAQDVPIDCPELVSYFECAAQVTCEELAGREFCQEEFDEIANCLPPE